MKSRRYIILNITRGCDENWDLYLTIGPSSLFIVKFKQKLSSRFGVIRQSLKICQFFASFNHICPPSDDSIEMAFSVEKDVIMSLHFLKLEQKLSSSCGEIWQSLNIRQFFAGFCHICPPSDDSIEMAFWVEKDIIMSLNLQKLEQKSSSSFGDINQNLKIQHFFGHVLPYLPAFAQFNQNIVLDRERRYYLWTFICWN